MKLAASLLLVFALSCASAQDANTKNDSLKFVTVPLTLDHNRIVIDVDLPLPDGSARRVRAWVDNGNPDLSMSRRLAMLLNLNVTCDDKRCSAPPPRDLIIGGMTISLAAVKKVEIPLKPVTAASFMASGMNAEINLPSTVLRSYDVLVNFPERQFSIGMPGTIPFHGVKNKVLINAENGLIQIPSKIENKNYNLAIDLGSSISFLSGELFDKLSAANADLPHMTGAVGPANTWGLDDEPNWKLMRLDRLQYGSIFLTDIPLVSFPKDRMTYFETRAGTHTAGLIGSQALLNHRIGIEYAHSAVYFEVGRTFKFPDFDVIGLVLRPEDDGRFTILGVADFDGKPSVDGVHAGDRLIAIDNIPVAGNTMGQVWAMLGGTPGKERKLTIEREGKRFAVAAQVKHFLGVVDEEEQPKRKKHS